MTALTHGLGLSLNSSPRLCEAGAGERQNLPPHLSGVIREFHICVHGNTISDCAQQRDVVAGIGIRSAFSKVCSESPRKFCRDSCFLRAIKHASVEFSGHNAVERGYARA